MPFSYADIVDPSLHKRLTAITKLISSKNHEKALARIQPLLKYAKPDTYDGALINQIAGYVYLGLNEYDEAIKYFKICVDSNKLPKQLTQDIKLTLAQLYLGSSQYIQAEKEYEEWIASAQAIQPSQYALGGSIYISSKKYDKAEKYLTLATKNEEENTESWLKLLLYVFYETKQLDKAKAALIRLIAHNPNKIDYWRRLSDTYYELGDRASALAVMQIAKQNNLLSSESDYLRLASLLSEQNLPFTSGLLLEKSLANNVLHTTPQLISTLFGSYSSAKENTRAIQELSKYSDAESQPELFMYAAYQYMENEEWDNAEKTLVQISKSNHDLPQSYLALAIVKINQNAFGEAKSWLDKALKNNQTRKMATEWAKYLRNLTHESPH